MTMFGFSILGVGLMCLVISAVTKYKNNGCKNACTSETTAEVIGIQEDEFPYPPYSFTGGDYTPMYRFKLNRKIYEFKGDSCSKNKHHVGETVSICVDPDSPDNFYTAEDMLTSDRFGEGFLIAGIIVLIVSAILFTL